MSKELYKLVERTNCLKHDGTLYLAPDFLLIVMGTEYGSSADDLSNIDYRMYREYGWDWEKKESIQFQLVNNLNGKTLNCEYKFGKLFINGIEIPNIWETKFGKQLIKDYKIVRDLKFDLAKDMASCDWSKALVMALKKYRKV